MTNVPPGRQSKQAERGEKEEDFEHPLLYLQRQQEHNDAGERQGARRDVSRSDAIDKLIKLHGITPARAVNGGPSSSMADPQSLQHGIDRFPDVRFAVLRR